MKITFKLKLAVLSVFYLPHLLLFFISRQKDVITADVNSFVNHEKISLSGIFYPLILALCDPYYRKLFYFRIGRISSLISWFNPGETNLKFGARLSLGEGIYIAHAYSTYLNAKSIGRCLSVRNCTTIGNKSDDDRDALPVIGDNVTIGANVCIIGNVVIGNNVIIGAGTVVTKDIPDNSVVVGNPGRVIKIKQEPCSQEK